MNDRPKRGWARFPGLPFLLAGLALFSACGSSEGPAKPSIPEAGVQDPALPPSPAEPVRPTSPAEPVRPPAFAGTWYPAGATALRAMVVGFLDKARTRKPAERVVALVSPHAGYRFSGPVAAEAFSAVRGKSYDTVVIVGISHRASLDGISVVPKGSYRTPLGCVPIHEPASKALLENPTGRIRFQAEAHVKEHSIEVQLPFLQVALEGGFRIVPVLIRARDPDDWAILADALEWIVGDSQEKILLVASADLAHFPRHEDAVKTDKEIVEALASLDPVALVAKNRDILKRGIQGLVCATCSLDALVPVIMASKALGGTRAVVLDVRNSFQVTGQFAKRVVGYGALAVLAGKEEGLSMKSKRVLISIARDAACAALGGEAFTPPDEADLPRELKGPGGAFVTLKNPSRAPRDLRGCLGNYNIGGTRPLHRVVANMARAATRDSRFTGNPVTLAEMKSEIRVEISVLSPFKRVKDPETIRMGVDGVSLVWGGVRRSVYLPQVALETGWDLATFLSKLCVKGSLPPDAWKDAKRMEFDLFTAEVFHE